MKKISFAIEGSDGAGKETQSRLLKEGFEAQGFKVASVSFPRYKQTTGGWVLYEALKGQESEKYAFSKLDPYAASLPYTMDRRESKGYLEQLISDHDVVIFDRYVENKTNSSIFFNCIQLVITRCRRWSRILLINPIVDN